MDVDDIIITVLVYLDDSGEIEKWCNKAMNIQSWENVRLTPEGNYRDICTHLYFNGLVLSNDPIYRV